MAAPSKVWTREEVLALQDAAPPGVRYELIDEDERPKIITRVLSWQPVAAIEPLTIDLRDLFNETRLGLLSSDDED